MVCSALRCQAWEFLSSLVLTWLHLDRSVCVYGCVRVCVCAWASECLATRSGHCAVPSSGIVLFHNLTVNKVGRYVLSFRHEEIMPGDGRRVVYTHQDSVSFQIIPGRAESLAVVDQPSTVFLGNITGDEAALLSPQLSCAYSDNQRNSIPIGDTGKHSLCSKTHARNACAHTSLLLRAHLFAAAHSPCIEKHAIHVQTDVRCRGVPYWG
jgi:hypothetical protein